MNDNFDLAAMRRMATLITPFAGQAILQCCDEIERWKARASLAQPAGAPADAFAVNFVRIAGLDKHKARECEDIVRQVLAAAPQAPQPAQAVLEAAGRVLNETEANGDGSRFTTDLRKLAEFVLNAAPSAQTEPIAALVNESERLGLYDVPEVSGKQAEQGGK